MKFMLLCYDDEKALESAGQAALQATMQEAIALTHELNGKGQYVLATPLQGTSTATCVRIRDGKRLITDGPFAETREFLGGFYIIDVKDQAEAIEIASRHPGLRFGGMEVRPIVELEGVCASQE